MLLALFLMLFAQPLDEAEQAMQEGRYQMARHFYRQVLAVDSTSFQARYGLARTLAFDGEWRTADSLYSLLLERDPDNGDVLLGRGLVRGWLGQYDAAERDLRRVLELAPDYGDAWMALANVHLWQDQRAEALETLESWSERAPDDPAPRLRSAQVLVQARRFPEARAMLTRAKRLGAPEVEISRLMRLMARVPAPTPWQAELGFERTWFTPERALWWSTVASLRHEFSWGSFAGGVRTYHRYDEDDGAVFADAWMNLWRGAYVNLRPEVTVQPEVAPHADLYGELFQGLGAGWEASVFWRHVRYPSGFETDTGGGSLGKYLGGWYIRWRSQVDVEQSLFTNILALRRYLWSVDDFIEVWAGRSEKEQGVFLTTTSPGEEGSFGLARLQLFPLRHWGLGLTMAYQEGTPIVRTASASLFIRW